MSNVAKLIIIDSDVWAKVSNVIDASSWFEIKPDTIEVPKKMVDGAPEWANVALSGWRDWLRFWGLETFREHPLAEKLLQLGMAVPPPTETEALRNIELQAKAQFAVNRSKWSGLSALERELVKYEDKFLEGYETEKFQRRHGVLKASQRYEWISKQTDGQMGIQQVRAILEEVTLVFGELVELEEIKKRDAEVDNAWRELVRETMREAA